MLIFREKLAFLLYLLARPISLSMFNGASDDAFGAGDKILNTPHSFQARAEKEEVVEQGTAADRVERLQRSIIELLTLTTTTGQMDRGAFAAAFEAFAANCIAVTDDLEEAEIAADEAEALADDPETAVG